MQENIGKLLIIIVILNSMSGFTQTASDFTQKVNDCKIGYCMKRLIRKIDKYNPKGNRLPCSNKDDRKLERLRRKYSKLDLSKKLCVLKSSSPSIQYILICFYFFEKKTPQQEVLNFFKNMKNPRMIECKGGGYSKLFDFILHRFQCDKENSPELFQVFVDNGGEYEDCWKDK